MPNNSGWRKLVLIVGAAVMLTGCAATGGGLPGGPHRTAEETRELLQKAEWAREHGEAGGAAFYYQEVLAKDEANLEALVGMGWMLLRQGDPESAERLFDKALQVAPEKVEALEGRGIARLQLRRFEAAAVDLEKATEMEEGRWEAWNGRGVIADLRGEYRQAQDYYRQALRILPGYPKGLNNLGYSLLMTHDYAEAEQVLGQGLQAAPNHPGLRINLGLALAWQGRHERALEVMTPVLGQARAANNVGYIALLNGAYEQAIPYFDQAIEHHPKHYSKALFNKRRAERLAAEAIRDQTNRQRPED